MIAWYWLLAALGVGIVVGFFAGGPFFMSIDTSTKERRHGLKAGS